MAAIPVQRQCSPMGPPALAALRFEWRSTVRQQIQCRAPRDQTGKLRVAPVGNCQSASAHHHDGHLDRVGNLS